MTQFAIKSRFLEGATASLLLAAAFSTVGTTAAQAQTTNLYAGGSTFAEKVYRDIMNCYGNHSGTDTEANLPSPPATCNGATPYNNNAQLLYVGSGSGRALNAFVAEDGQAFNVGRVPDNPPVASVTGNGPFYGTGLGASWVPAKDTGTGGTNKFPKVSFVGSDDPLGANQTTYDGNKAAKGWGNAIQVPAFVGAVAIPFNAAAGGFNEHGKKPAGGNNTALASSYSSLVDFSIDTLCGIWTNKITDWSDPAITKDNGNVQLGAGTITKFYRSDSSGTTFLFTNGLVHQCAETSHPVPASWQTAVNGTAHNNSGVGDNSWFSNVAAAGLLDSSYVAEPGSKGIHDNVVATTGSIGYVSTDFVVPFSGPQFNQSNVQINPKAANIQTYATLHNNLTPVFKAPNPKTALPIVGAAKAPLSTAASCPVGSAFGQSPDGICSHNPANWGVTFPQPLSTAAYPLGGFTFMDVYTCYASSADVTALVGTAAGHLGYLRWFFGSTTENGSLVKNSLAANGFTTVPGSWSGGAKKLLTTDKKTKISTPGTANTGCAGVTGAGA